MEESLLPQRQQTSCPILMEPSRSLYCWPTPTLYPFSRLTSGRARGPPSLSHLGQDPQENCHPGVPSWPALSHVRCRAQDDQQGGTLSSQHPQGAAPGSGPQPSFVLCTPSYPVGDGSTGALESRTEPAGPMPAQGPGRQCHMGLGKALGWQRAPQGRSKQGTHVQEG